MAASPEMVSEKGEIGKILDEETLLIIHSGETPEIAFHSSLFYLFEDEDGPKLRPDGIDLAPLKRAVFQRYRKILLRDMEPAYRDKRIYRGLARSIANWYRLKAFCEKEGLDMRDIKREARLHLLHFLKNETEELAGGKRESSCINCSWKDLKDFTAELGVNQMALPERLKKLCSRK